MLAVYGAKDSVVQAQQADAFGEDKGATRAVVLDESRHFPMLDAAPEFNRLLLDFLRADLPEEINSLGVKEQWRRRWR